MANKNLNFMIMNNEADICLTSLIRSYDIHTSLFSRMIEEIYERDLNHFRNDSNQIPWLIGNQVQLRYDAANLMGIEEKQAAEELFRNNKSVQQDITYPSLASFNNDWKNISPILRYSILELDHDELFSYSGKKPGMEGTFFDLLSKIIQREANCISMITLWRGI